MFAARTQAIKHADRKRKSLEKVRQFSLQSSSLPSYPLEQQSSAVSSTKDVKDGSSKRVENNSCENQESTNTWISWVRTKIRFVLKSNIFESFMFLCIIITAFMAGIETYPNMKELKFMRLLDTIITICFTIECILKILSEVPRIWNFWIGYNWKWNIFDFSVVVVNLIPMPADSSSTSITLLYLLRLMRLAKIVHKVPQLQIILMGLVGGLSSAGYILILLFLVLYLYALVALFLFRENNPWHYANLQTALLSLFRASTLEDWTDIMYVDLLGCDSIDTLYVQEAHRTEANKSFWCTSPSSHYITASLFWVSFIVIAGLIMLSLFVGTITNNMSASLHEIKYSLETARKEQLRKRQLYALSNNGRSFRLTKKISASQLSMRNLKKKKEEPTAFTYFFGTKMSKEEKMNASAKISALIQAALRGVSIDEYEVDGSAFRKWYWKCSRICNRIIEHWIFSGGIVLTTLCAGVLVGIQTDEEFFSEHETFLDLLESIVLGIFIAEMLLKVIAEDKHPLKVFQSRWNCFDMLILIGSFVLMGNSGGDLLNILRLLRLLRILKLIKIFPQLQGLASVGFISFLLVLDLYVFSLVGMILFAENDPWHFGSLQVRSDVMYINIYGCDIYGYLDFPSKCTSPNARGWIAAVFFLIFIAISALVLLTLFVGVVSTSMDEAQEKQDRENVLERRIKEFQKELSISDDDIKIYRNAFDVLDLDNSGTIEMDELKLLLKSVGKDVTEEGLFATVELITGDTTKDFDLAHFMRFMFLQRQEIMEFDQVSESKSNAT